LDDIGIGFYTQNFGDAQFYDRLNGGVTTRLMAMILLSRV